MKKMKKVLSLVLAGVMALMLVACGSTDTAGGSDNGGDGEKTGMYLSDPDISERKRSCEMSGYD